MKQLNLYFCAFVGKKIIIWIAAGYIEDFKHTNCLVLQPVLYFMEYSA
jgi:hypothetical protein